MHTFVYWTAWTELRLAGWQLMLFHCFLSIELLARIYKWLMSQEMPSRQLLLLSILSGYWLFSPPHFLLSQRNNTASNVSPTTSLCFLLPLLLMCSALMVRFAPHLICNSSVSCGSECTLFKICSWKNMLWYGDLFWTVTNSGQQRLFSCFAGRLALEDSTVPQSVETKMFLS